MRRRSDLLVPYQQNDVHLAQHIFEHHDASLCSCGFDGTLEIVGVWVLLLVPAMPG
jgi:hypothetical protein